MPMMPGPLAAATYATIPIAASSSLSEGQVYAGALPIRIAVWGVVLALFYGYRERRGPVISALFADVLRSCLLDGAMAIC